MKGSVRPILEVATRLGLDPAALEPYGRFKAKVALEAIASLTSDILSDS